MSAQTRPRVPAGVTTGGQFAASARGESAADLTVPAHLDFVGADAAGVFLVRDDWVTEVAAGGGSDPWRVEGARDGKVELQSVDDPTARRLVDGADYEVMRPDPDSPYGEPATRTSVDHLAQVAEEWAERDPAYAARLAQVIDRLTGPDLPARDAIFTDPVDLVRSTENHDGSDVAVRRHRAVELAVARPLPRISSQTRHPAKVGAARSALRATRDPGRVVSLRGLDTIGKDPFEVRGNDTDPLVVINRSGFSHLRVTSGAALIHAESASGNAVTVTDGATAVIFASPGRKVSVSVEGSGVAVLVSSQDVHGYQRRDEGEGSLDVLREETDRLTVRTPSSDKAVRP
ncbi:hypothetical protein [Cellulosimicrobium sp. Marseille-Q4280]|uniref:hypothetical protein n=1 Tax=Cellulosimicrobium sp. Marseille-Q4280 TaxID=2937992 RepID=UPI00203F3892|nr:hypothetical protein [Cellulosimicrobium sp. Marseille-Q4280]